MTYPAVPLGYLIEVAPEADPTADPDTYSWTDVTTDLAAGIPITHKRGSDDEQGDSSSESTFVFRNPDRRWSTDNPLSDMWPGWRVDCPVRCSLSLDGSSSWTELWTQYAAEITDTWGGTGERLPRTHVRLDGIFRRLGQGDELRSALYRSMVGVAADDYVPLTYWPMEDGRYADRFASGLTDGTPMTYTGTVTPADDDELLGSAALPTFSAGAGATFVVPTYTDTGQWTIQTLAKLTASCTIYDLTCDGTGRRFVVAYTSGTTTISFTLYDAAGASVYSGSTVLTADTVGVWLSLTLEWRDLATDQFNFTHRAIGSSTFYNFADVIPGRYGRIVGGTLMTGVAGDVNVGHHAVFVDPAFTLGLDDHYHALAANGWDGEMAHDRIARLLRELRIPADITATTSTRLGPQQPGKALDVLRQAEAADHGRLDDSRGRVAYRAYSEMIGQDPALIIDADEYELGFPLTPTTDDQALVNKSTVGRIGGSGATVDRSAGAAERVRDKELNLYSDDQPVQHASWYIAAGSVGGKRVPQISVNLLAAPQLAAAVLALKLGDRVQVVNCPLTLSASGTLDLIFVGWDTSTYSRRAWRITANCASYEPYRVATYGPDAARSRYGTASSRLATGVDADDTSWSVATTGSALWIQTATHPDRFYPAGDTPLMIEVGGPGGIVYECTAISGASSPQTFTVPRLVADRSWDADTPVRPFRAGRYALGSG